MRLKIPASNLQLEIAVNDWYDYNTSWYFINRMETVTGICSSPLPIRWVRFYATSWS